MIHDQPGGDISAGLISNSRLAYFQGQQVQSEYSTRGAVRKMNSHSKMPQMNTESCSKSFLKEVVGLLEMSDVILIRGTKRWSYIAPHFCCEPPEFLGEYNIVQPCETMYKHNPTMQDVGCYNLSLESAALSLSTLSGSCRFDFTGVCLRLSL